MATYMIPEVMCQPVPLAQCMTLDLPKDRSPHSDPFRKLVGDFAEASLDMLSRPPGMRWDMAQTWEGERRILVKDEAAMHENDRWHHSLGSGQQQQQQHASAQAASQDGGRSFPLTGLPAEIRDMVWEMTLDILEPETFTAIHRYRPLEPSTGGQEPPPSSSSSSPSLSPAAPGPGAGTWGDPHPHPHPPPSWSQWFVERQGPRMRRIAAYWVCRESRCQAVRAYGDPAGGRRLLFFNPRVDRMRFSVLSADWVLSSRRTITVVGGSTMVDVQIRASAANGQRLARELDVLHASAPGGQVISLWGGARRQHGGLGERGHGPAEAATAVAAGTAAGGGGGEGGRMDMDARRRRRCWRRNGLDPPHPGAIRPGPERYLNETGQAVLFAVDPALLGRVERLDLLLYCDPFRDPSRMVLGFSSVLSPTFALRELHSVLRAFPAVADLRLRVGVQFHRATLDAPHQHRRDWWRAFLASFTGLPGRRPPPRPRRDSGMWLSNDDDSLDVDGGGEDSRDGIYGDTFEASEQLTGQHMGRQQEGTPQTQMWGTDLANELFEPPILWSDEDPLPPAYALAFDPGRYRTRLPRLQRLEVCQAHCFPTYGRALDSGDDVCGFRFCEDPACNPPLEELTRPWRLDARIAGMFLS